MHLNVSKLCQDSHECARDKGWLESPRTSCDIMNLFVSEISEALEDYRANKGLDEIWYEAKFKEDDGKVTKEIVTREDIEKARSVEGKYGRGRAFLDAKPCGIPVEIADWVIRVGEYCGTNKLDLSYWYEQHMNDILNRGELASLVVGIGGFDEFLSALTVYSVQSLRHPKKVLDVAPLGTGLAVAVTYCIEQGIPLMAAIEEKHTFNLTRSHRHGGKKI